MITPMLQRIGIFLLCVGLLLVIFAFSSGNPFSENTALFFAGLAMAMMGATLWFRHREKVQAQRFRLFRRTSAKEKEKET